MTNNRLEIGVFLTFVVAWIIVYALIAPPFGGTDVFIFKDAGANLALGEGFRSIPAPYFDGDPTLRVFSSYTPFYPLLYGLWGLAFGIGPYSSAYFDLALAIIAASLTLYVLTSALERRRERLLSAVILGGALPAGAVFMASDRPEILGYILSVTVLLLWRKAAGSELRSILVIGAAAFVFLANPFAGLMTLVMVSVLQMTDRAAPHHPAPSRVARIRRVACGWILFGVICASAALFLLAYDHDALRRFSQHAFGRESGAGVLRNISGVSTLWSFYTVEWRQAFLGASIGSLATSVSLAVCCLIAAPYLLWTLLGSANSHAMTINAVIAALVIGMVLTPLVIFPRQVSYYGLDRALIPIFLVVSQTLAAERLRRARLPLILVAAGLICAVPAILVQVVQRWESRASYLRARHEIGAITAQMDPEKYIAVSSSAYPIVKPVHPKLVDAEHLVRADQTDFIDGLIISRAGSPIEGAAKIPLPPALAGIAWRPLNPAAAPVFIRLFGKRVMRSQWGWAVDGYRR